MCNSYLHIIATAGNDFRTVWDVYSLEQVSLGCYYVEQLGLSSHGVDPSQAARKRAYSMDSLLSESRDNHHHHHPHKRGINADAGTCHCPRSVYWCEAVSGYPGGNGCRACLVCSRNPSGIPR